MRSTHIVAMAAIGAGAAAIAAYRRQRRSTVTDEVTAPVTIDRDAYGVPRITAQSATDAYVGLGFAIAEDRLFQMDLLRRTAYGQLSEVVGSVGLESDRFMRLLGIHRVADSLVEAASAEARIATEAFTTGVNVYMQRRALPVEFRVLRYRPEPWRAADSLALLRLMGWILSAFHRHDLLAERLRTEVGDAWTEAIFAGRVAESPLVVREASRSARPGQTGPIPGVVLPPGGASNAWAVAGERTVSGAPLLANDPHLGYTNPSIWCEASLDAPGLHVTGVTMPGVPGFLIGRTASVAWGVVAAMISQTFLYRERLSQDGRSVAEGETWLPLEERVERIHVKGGVPEQFIVRSTPRGPLLSDLEPHWCEEPFSLHWTGTAVSADIDAVLRLNLATSLDDALRTRDVLLTPPVNVIMADVYGEIACASVGAFADRSTPPGLLDPAQHPPRYIPAADLPLERNPARGWVACANNRIVGKDYPYGLHGFYEPQFRIRRISEVLDRRQPYAAADMRALQLDVRTLHAAELTPVLLEQLGGDAPPWAIADLEAWDFEATPGSRATLLFEAFYHQWQRAALGARLSDDMVDLLTSTLTTSDVPMGFCDRLLKGECPAWLDDAERRRIVRESFLAGLRWIVCALGPNHEEWTWGAVHTVTFVHPFGRATGRHQRFVNVGPFPLGGERTTVCPFGVSTREPFAVVGGPSMRLVADLQRPDLTWITNTLGQSGRLLGRSARNQVGDFVAGRMHQAWGQVATRQTTLYPPTRP
jgi:penicillin amidase